MHHPASPPSTSGLHYMFVRRSSTHPSIRPIAAALSAHALVLRRPKAPSPPQSPHTPSAANSASPAPPVAVVAAVRSPHEVVSIAPTVPPPRRVHSPRASPSRLAAAPVAASDD